jgi:putative transposase
MPDKYQNKYRIPSARLQTWDYGSNASYFITICTKNREHSFGEILDDEMHLNEIGKLAEQYWLEIAVHFSYIELGNFVIMPNHVHGILIIDNPLSSVASDVVETRQCLVSTDTNKKTIGQMRFQNQGKGTLSSIVGSYKSVVTKNAHYINSGFAWQSRFQDHIIRDAKSFDRIQNYISNNPLNWKDDKFYN